MDLFNLKLQHMSKFKFVTANDFFQINYPMLFNVKLSTTFFFGDILSQIFLRFFPNKHKKNVFLLQMCTAIVTHMVILLQFQQWVDLHTHE